MTKRVKWGIAGAVVVGLLAVGGVVGAKRGDKPVEVRIEPVAKRDLVSSVTASGQVQPQTKVNVSPDVAGRIIRLAVVEGQMVTKGQFLLQLDAAPAEAAVQRSEASLAGARAQSAQANASVLQSRRNYERSVEIRKTNAQLVSDEQLEQLSTQLEVNVAMHEASRNRVQEATAALRDARTSLAKTTILAPMSGRVTRLNVETGETAVPGTFNKDAATLLTISDMSVLETRVKVDETNVAKISVGDSAVVEIDAFPDTTFVGRVVEISNSSVRLGATGQPSDQAIDYEVVIQLINAPADTRPDFSATAKVITETRKAVLSIPIIALTVRENEAVPAGDTAGATLAGGGQPTREVGKKDVEGVFVIGADNKVTFRPVRRGIAGDKYFEVVSGLRAGERIVAGTYQAIRELKEGAIVRDAKVTDDAKKKKEKAA